VTDTDRPSQQIRLQKVLASAGVGSRRSCESLIANGHVEVDGTVVTDLGTRVDPESVVIRVDGERLPVAAGVVYLAVNKPRGVVSTMSDEQGRRDLRSLVGDRAERLFHVGRLDTDTSGLLLLTNDGEFAHRLAHPSYQVPKTYVALVRGVVKGSTVERLISGVDLDDGRAQADAVAILDRYEQRSSVEITLHEGRNRIVRRMLDAVGHPVEQLSRTSIGPVRLGGLKPGDTRDLSQAELGALLERLGL
jgi:23S rRNA pseudouridine2605 synthase